MNNALLQLVMLLVMIGVFLSIGAMIISDMQGDMTQNTTEWNATTHALIGIGNISTWLPVIGIIIAAVVIIALVKSMGSSWS